MHQPASKSIDVFMTLDRLGVDGYFNKHDPAPIYKRQLSHEFEAYINASVKSAGRYSVIFYKLKCSNDLDKQYAEPLMYAIRRHFTEKLEDRNKAFQKFKNRSWIVLAFSIAIVTMLQWILPHIINEESSLHTGLINSLDIFSWVMLWHPIDELVFHWNPHLKDICLLNKLANSEYIIISNEKKNFSENKSINENSLVDDTTLWLNPKRNNAVSSRSRAVL